MVAISTCLSTGRSQRCASGFYQVLSLRLWVPTSDSSGFGQSAISHTFPSVSWAIERRYSKTTLVEETKDVVYIGRGGRAFLHQPHDVADNESMPLSNAKAYVEIHMIRLGQRRSVLLGANLVHIFSTYQVFLKLA